MKNIIAKSFEREIEKNAGFFGKAIKKRLADPLKEYTERAVTEAIRKHKKPIEKEVRKNIRKLLLPAAAVGVASGTAAGGLSYLAGKRSRDRLEKKLNTVIENMNRRK